MIHRPRLGRLVRLFAASLVALVAAGGQAFAAAPTVTAVSGGTTTGGVQWFNGVGGQTVTIHGTGFFCGGTASCVTGVTIGGISVTPSNVTDTSLTATTPTDTPSASPTVGAFPGSVTPKAGGTGGGTGVTINGTGFGQTVPVVVTTTSGSATGNNLFYYNDVQSVAIGGSTAASFNFVNPTQLTTTTPPGIIGVGNVIVVLVSGTNTGASGNNEFAYVQGSPSISGISPAFGLTGISTNTPITINGGNFITGTFQDGTRATTVTFGCNGGTNPSTATVSNVAILTATVPLCATAGAVTVRVTLADGSNTSQNYLYVAPQQPLVTQITNNNTGQNTGATAGGDPVTISGSNFIGATQVTIGGTAVSGFTVKDGGHITTTTPPGTAGQAAVSVTVPQASPSTGTLTGANSWIYLPPVPQVLLVSPNYGGTVGGDKVTIRGSGFTYATKVSFGPNSVTCPSASCTIVSDGELDVLTPAGTAGSSIDVTVTSSSTAGGGGTSSTSSADQFSYVALATVTGVSPNAGKATGGTTVTISGTNFTNQSTVIFGSVPVPPANVTFNGSTTLTVTAPAGPAGSAVDVQVSVPVTPSGSTTPVPAYSQINSSDKYSFLGAPPVNSVSPNTGPTAGGQTVTINGSGFFCGGSSSCVSSVTIGGTAATSVTVTSDTTLTATTPAGSAGSASVIVTTPNGSTPANSNLYTYYGAPTITTISPTSGPAGTSVTITGTNFGGRTTVQFGNNNFASTLSVNSATSITAIAPPGTGTVTLTVTTPGGQATATFTYTVPPTISITSPNPPQGPQGSSVVITASAGTLTGATAVQFGGVNATSFNVTSATSITATAPPGTGTVSVTVATPSGTATTTNQFTYIGAPTVTSVSPPSGPPAGNYQVTISGTNLAGVTAVKFGTTSATTFTYSAGTQQITATVPAGSAGTVDVTVTTAVGTSAINRPGDQFTYTTAPAVTAISPTSGPSAGGTSVTITGNNLAGATAVKFGGNAGTILSIGPTTIVATSPAGTGIVDVSVTTPAGTSATSAADKFTYIPPAPTIIGFTPTTGPAAGGTSVTITGTNLGGATAVTFGTTAAVITANTATSITVTSPAGTGAVTLTVTTPGGTVTSNGKFTYVAPAPTVTSVAPNAGSIAGNATVIVTGTNFTGATAVKFGGTNAASFVVNSATQITAVTPAGSPGAVDVTVTTPAGTSAINQPADQYTYIGPPAVTALSINTGPPGGGTTVTITGSNFTGATVVYFGGTPVTTFTVNPGGTSITLLAPPGSGAVDVTVVTPSGTSAIGPSDRFTYSTKATTAMNLTSSPNPSNYGQPVTFTAVVSGNAPTGIVTFTQGSTVLGTAPLRAVNATSSSAAITISSLAVGADIVTASYPGDVNNAADPESVTQIVNGAADSVKLRQLQIAAMSAASNTSAQAITGAIDNAIGAGFSGSCPLAPRQNGSGFTYCFGGDDPPPQNPAAGQQASARINSAFSALGYADGVPGTASSEPLNLAPSSAPPNFASTGDPTLGAITKAVVPYREPRAWLAWFDVRVGELDRSGPSVATNDLRGLQGNTMFGLTRRFSPNFLIGVTAGYENFQYKSDAYNGVLRGQGVTGGAYLGWMLSDSLRFEAASTWSDIFVNESAGTATGQFTGQRLLAFGSLTGNFGMWGTTFEPSAQIYALWERENSYVDSLGAAQAAHEFDTGRASGGMKASHGFEFGAGRVAPYLGLYGDYYFTMDNANGVQGLTAVPLMQGWAARATGGITTVFPGGSQVSVGGELGGIGNTTQIWTVNVRGSVPF